MQSKKIKMNNLIDCFVVLLYIIYICIAYLFRKSVFNIVSIIISTIFIIIGAILSIITLKKIIVKKDRVENFSAYFNYMFFQSFLVITLILANVENIFYPLLLNFIVLNILYYSEKSIVKRKGYLNDEHKISKYFLYTMHIINYCIIILLFIITPLIDISVY